MNKKILYIDMDGVVADFHSGVKALDSRVGEDFSNPDLIDELVEANPTLFENLPPIKDAILSVHKLMEKYEVYFLSTPMWNVPESFKGKRLWLEKHFGKLATKRLILTHRKDLNMGDYLIDDRTKNGAGEFKGELIQFATKQYPNWDSVLNKLL